MSKDSTDSEVLALKLKKIISDNGAMPTIDEELSDDLKNGTVAVINKLTEVSNSSNDEENLISTQKISEHIKNKGIDVVNAELNKQGKTLITADNGNNITPMKTHQGHFISVNKIFL